TYGMDRRARKLFRQTKVAQDIVNEYDFFDEYFSYRNTNGQGTMAYDKLFKVIETRTHFYLMLSKVQGYTIAKDEAPAGFTEFMQKKIAEYHLKA
ncbi:MAG: YcxB family protein, partial [Prevotellaceae bacterium]|nr:YcxB family protein [Prevotellaceae bacterium]